MLVIFDCDGVLVDSETLSAEILAEAFTRQGLLKTLSEVLETYRGKSVPDCVAYATGELAQLPAWQGLDAEAVRLRGTEFWHQMQADTIAACYERLRPIAGVREVLDGLVARNIKRCVASNGKHEKMQITLPLTNLLEYFGSDIFSYEDVRVGKPAPDLFLHAAAKLQVAPDATLVIEDSLTGMRAALAAGMKPFAYCPPDADGRANVLLNDVQALGVEVFTDMGELLSLIDREALRINAASHPTTL